MAGVELSGIGKVFGGDVTALDGVSLSVDDGEFVVLLGPSGCGKSTLLRIVAGLEKPTAGTVAIDGRVVNDVPGKQRDIAMVFQNYALYPQMTVAENMAFPLRIRKHPKSEITQRISEVAGLLEIDELLSRKPGELSGGQQQRVAMARALVRRPAVLLMDEPLSNLDARLRDQTRKEIRRLQRTAGVTTIYVTHDQAEALTMADRVVVMRLGEIEQIAAPIDLYRSPASAFVASFVGSPPRSLIAGSVADGQLVVGDSTFGLAGAPALSGAVSVAIRPDAARLVAPGTPDGSGELSIEVEVDLAEPLGSETLLEVAPVVRGSPDTDNLIRVRVSGEEPPRIGTRLRLRAPWAAVELFDVDDGCLLWRGGGT